MTDREYITTSATEAAWGFAAGVVLVAVLFLLQGCGDVEGVIAVTCWVVGGCVALFMVGAWAARAVFGPGCDCGRVDDGPHSLGCSAKGTP